MAERERPGSLLVQPARSGAQREGEGGSGRRGEEGADGKGEACSTLVPLFSRTTCSVCTAACGTPGGNQTSVESSRNSQALLGSGGGARAGMKQWSKQTV